MDNNLVDDIKEFYIRVERRRLGCLSPEELLHEAAGLVKKIKRSYHLNASEEDEMVEAILGQLNGQRRRPSWSVWGFFTNCGESFVSGLSFGLGFGAAAGVALIVVTKLLA